MFRTSYVIDPDGNSFSPKQEVTESKNPLMYYVQPQVNGFRFKKKKSVSSKKVKGFTIIML